MREEVLLLLTDVEPESRASETVGTPRAIVALSPTRLKQPSR